jgi:hypothetical protein
VKKWEAFWVAYRAEKSLLEAFNRGELGKAVMLPLLNKYLLPRLSCPARHRTKPRSN